MDPQAFLLDHAKAVIVVVLVVVGAYLVLSAAVAILRLVCAPPDGTKFDGVLDIGEGLVAYSGKILVGLSKLAGRWSPEAQVVGELVAEVEAVTGTLQTKAANAAPAKPVAPDPNVVLVTPAPAPVSVPEPAPTAPPSDEPTWPHNEAPTSPLGAPRSTPPDPDRGALLPAPIPPPLPTDPNA